MVSTGAGTASSIAALIVQRPSPESETRPANFASAGSSISEAAVRSSSQEAITLPRRQTSAMSRERQIVLIIVGIAERSRFGVDGLSFLADVGPPQNRQAFGIGGHDAVLDAVVDHFDEVPGPVRPAVQIAVFGRAADCPSRPGVRGAESTGGASVAKIGSSRLTISTSPPIIWQ